MCTNLEINSQFTRVLSNLVIANTYINPLHVLYIAEYQSVALALFLPAGCMRNAWPAGPKITLRFMCLHLCVSTLSSVQYLRHVAMPSYFSRLWQIRWLLCVVVQHSYKFKMDTEKQRQHRCDDSRLTKSRNARSKQLTAMPTESLTNREWLPGELLSGSEH